MIKIKLGEYQKEIAKINDLATCLEFTLTWGDSSDDNVDLLRVCAAAIGVGLDSENLLPRYRPEKDKIFVYGRKILERLLVKNIPMNDIYTSGTAILKTMAEAIPQNKEVEDKKDFFHSEEEDT
jgi:hypothetical protein